MKALILCGGQGMRLREHTELRPKPLVEIGGRPILWHIMKLYAHHGIDEFVLCLGYKGDLIKDYFLNYEARSRDFTVSLGDQGALEFHGGDAEREGWRVTLADTGELAQTGARIKRAARYLGDDPGTFAVTYGDGVSDVDLSCALKLHRERGALATMTGVRPSSRYGEVRTDGDQVTVFSEKPQVSEGLINGGFFFFEPGFLEYLSEDDDCVLEHAPLECCAGAGELFVYEHPGYWQCMDTYRDWHQLDNRCRSGDAPWQVWRTRRA